MPYVFQETNPSIPILCGNSTETTFGVRLGWISSIEKWGYIGHYDLPNGQHPVIVSSRRCDVGGFSGGCCSNFSLDRLFGWRYCWMRVLSIHRELSGTVELSNPGIQPDVHQISHPRCVPVRSEFFDVAEAEMACDFSPIFVHVAKKWETLQSRNEVAPTSRICQIVKTQ